MFAVVQKALQAAAATDGLFDPTVLNALLAAGYQQSFEQLQDTSNCTSEPLGVRHQATWRDVEVDEAIQTIKLHRRWQHDGAMRHHLIDPRRGTPVDSGVVQATVVAPTVVEAEMLAKAALLLGPEAGFDYLRQKANIVGVLVLANRNILSISTLGEEGLGESWCAIVGDTFSGDERRGGAATG